MDSTEQPEPRLVSMRDAVERAGVTEHTLRRWARNGRLRRYKTPVGGGPGRPSVFFDLNEIERLTRPVAS